MNTYIDAVHFTLFLSVTYGAYVFYNELSDGRNRFTVSMFLITLTLIISELWSLGRLQGIFTSDGLLLARAIQISLYQLSLIHLAYTSISLRRQRTKESDDQEKGQQLIRTTEKPDSQ